MKLWKWFRGFFKKKPLYGFCARCEKDLKSWADVGFEFGRGGDLVGSKICHDCMGAKARPNP
jgi:hypothetical protein